MQNIFIVISFMAFFPIVGQDDANERIKIARDSMIANPKYSYQLLSKVLKNDTKHDSIQAIVELYLGNYFNDIGVVDSSLYYTQKALEHLDNQKDIAKAYRTLGSCYRRSGKMDDAIAMLFESLEICEKIEHKDLISSIKSDLGILYTQKKDFDKALAFFKESIAAATKEQDIYGNYVNIGAAYFFKGDLDNAEHYFIKAFELMPPEKDPKVSATIALNIGSVKFENKKFKEAMIYFEKSKQIADTHGFKDKSLNALEHKALAINELGDHKKAIVILKQALVSAKEISSLFTQKNIHQNLVEIYSKNNNYKDANRSLKAFHVLKDSINYGEQRQEITELEVKYETAKKEKEILALKEEQLIKNEELKREQLLKKIFLIGFLVILIPISSLLFVYYQKLQVTKKYNVQEEEIYKQKNYAFLKQQELELANTYVIAQNEERSRIARELHDTIGGNLAAIKLQMVNIQKENGLADTIINYLDDTYQQVREISHNLTPRGMHKTVFTDYLDDYIKMIKKVVDIDITFIPHPKESINEIDDNLKVEIFKIIQELFTNALKHSQAKSIEVCLNAYQEKIEILFEDNGIGFNMQEQTNGIGIQNIRKRLSFVNGTMDIDSMQNRGTAIRIEILITHG